MTKFNDSRVSYNCVAPCFGAKKSTFLKIDREKLENLLRFL